MENTIVRESFEEVAMQQQVSKSSMHDEQKRAALKAALFAAAFNIKVASCLAQLAVVLLVLQSSILLPSLRLLTHDSQARLCGVNSDDSVKTHFDYVFDINDYPQQARWKVTHKVTPPLPFPVH